MALAQAHPVLDLGSVTWKGSWPFRVGPSESYVVWWLAPDGGIVQTVIRPRTERRRLRQHKPHRRKKWRALGGRR